MFGEGAGWKDTGEAGWRQGGSHPPATGNGKSLLDLVYVDASQPTLHLSLGFNSKAADSAPGMTIATIPPFYFIDLNKQ